jgi:hypothetical protein
MPLLRMPHHATLCSSCLNCQSNFGLKVFLLFSTPTVVSLSFYSFFYFSHASVILDFLNWLFTCLLYACLIMQRCVPAFVFQQSCSSSRVSTFVFQQSCSSIRVPAFVFQQSCSSIRVPAVVFQHSCSSSRVPAFVFQQSCSSIHVPAVVFQHSCSSIVFQRSCSSIHVRSITDCHQ